MNLYRDADYQRGKYAALEGFLRFEVPRFVRQHPTVCRAVLKYGFGYDNDTPRPPARGSIVSTPLGRLNFALLWTTPPLYLVMQTRGRCSAS
ncbi:MAG: hypothetical protein K2X87_31625 [Gemmataceae bacterium]|nr:hypothetical protein [Gemmataceae bacterium]